MMLVGFFGQVQAVLQGVPFMGVHVLAAPEAFYDKFWPEKIASRDGCFLP